MIDFSAWKERTFAVTALQLDPRNPRIPETDTPLSQRQLIAELVRHDKIYELAKSIVDHGYFPVELLIGVEENGKRYIVEGNRRLAALKLLVSPELAQDVRTTKKFKQLSEQTVVSEIKKVKVLLAPSRALASVYVKNKHTGTNFERWSPVMQARFYRELIDDGLSVKDVAEQYGSTPSEVADFLQMHEMYQVACALDLLENIAEIVRNPRDFPMTNLERLYKYPGVTKFLGIQFDSNGTLTGRIAPSEFRKGYGQIVSDVAQKTVTSRTHNTVEQIDEYLEAIEEKPDLSQNGSFSAESVINEGQKGEPYESKVIAVPKPRKKAVRKTRVLIPNNIKCDLNDKRTADVFVELRGLDVEKYNNAVSVLLRVLLELSVGNYLDKTGKIDNIIAKAKAKQSKGKDWYPTLRQMLNHIVNDDPDFITHPLAMKALKQLVAKDNTLLTVETLDSFVHNKYVFPSEKELRELWVQLEEVFKVLLVEPPAVEE